jgi:hypothetical protein
MKRGRILIQDILWLGRKKLGLDIVDLTERLYAELDRNNYPSTEYVTSNFFIKFFNGILSEMDMSKMNALDYESFLRHSDDLIINGSRSPEYNMENAYEKEATCAYRFRVKAKG